VDLIFATKIIEMFLTRRKYVSFIAYWQWWARAIKENVRRNGKGRKLYKSKDLSLTNRRPHIELYLLITGASLS